MYEFHFKKKSSSSGQMSHYVFENPYYRMVIHTADWSEAESGILYPIDVKPIGKDLDVVPELTVGLLDAEGFISIQFPPGISAKRLRALSEWLSHMEAILSSIRMVIRDMETGKYG